MSSCLHRMTFLSRYAAKNAVSRSRVVDAYWLCPECKFWVAGNYEDAPVEALTSEIGIFSTIPHPTP